MNPTAHPSMVLCQRHMVSILFVISEEGRVNKTTLYNRVSRNGNIPQKLGILQNAGLIEMTDHGLTTIIELTDAGRDVVEHLRCIDSIMTTPEP